MASLPPISALQLEGMLDSEGAIQPDKLVFALNQFIGGTHNALNRQLTFSGNFAATVKDVRVTLPAEPPWRAVGASGQPAFENSWVNHSAANYAAGFLMMPAGEVWVRGVVNSGSGVPSSIFTLPVGYRPSMGTNRAQGSNSAFGMLTVGADGLVTVNAGSTTWFEMDARFFATSAALPAAFTGAGWPFLVAHGLPKCTGLQLLACTSKDSKRANISGAPVLDWEDAGDGRVRIKSAWGLQWGQSYTLRLLMLSE